ncbi:MAG: hypothetical protein NDJ89_08865 [Oligoflexia bacterium]|nr:hypothetical protein [Oligoflexia bacterium]
MKRLLRLSVAGRWYVAFTLGLGFAAIASANNALYLIESLLLSAILLSGVLSEKFVHSVELRILRGQAIAGKRVGDLVELTNRGKTPVFCIEICEWQRGQGMPLAYFPRLDPGETLRLPSLQILPLRGRHSWSSLAVVTRYPFGLARKIRLQGVPSERIVWPSPATPKSAREPQSPRGSDDRIRPFAPGDDFRSIVWTLSSKEPEPLVRARAGGNPAARPFLDPRGLAEPDLEARISEIAKTLYETAPEEASAVTLTLLRGAGEDTGTRQVTRGLERSLDALALLKPEPGPAPGGGR